MLRFFLWAALEPKRDIKRRIGRSPDHGDALALAIAAQTPPVPAMVFFVGGDDDYDLEEEDQKREEHRKMTLKELLDHPSWRSAGRASW